MAEAVTRKVDKFFGHYRLQKYPKGQILILDDDGADHVYYLVKGRIKQYDVSQRGDELVLNLFKPPAFFPMSLAINKTPNPYIFEADSYVEARQAPADEVVAFLKANPDVMFDLLSRLYRGVDGVLGRMAKLMASSAESRVLYELLLDARRFGAPQKDGSLKLDLTEKDLASRAGLSRETVSREVRKLKEKNLVGIRTRSIEIMNIVELEKELGRTG